MRTFSQKSIEPTKPISFISRGRLSAARNNGVHCFLPLRPTIHNQFVQRSQWPNTEDSNVSPVSNVANILAYDFTSVPVYANAPDYLQRNQRFRVPSEQYQREVDPVTEKVTVMPEPQLQLTSIGFHL